MKNGARSRFTSHHFQFTSRLLGSKRSGELKASKEEVEKYLKEMHSDPNREVRLEQFEKQVAFFKKRKAIREP